MKKHLSLIGILPFLAFGCSAPKTLPEFRSWARSSSQMKKKEYSVDGLSLAKAEERLRAFSNRCMRKEVKSSIGVNQGYGTASHTSVSTYNSRVLKEKNRVSLVVQREDTDSVGYPDGGVYEFLAEATPASSGGVNVFSANFSLRMPDGILNDVEGWLRGKGQFCPF